MASRQEKEVPPPTKKSFHRDERGVARIDLALAASVATTIVAFALNVTDADRRMDLERAERAVPPIATSGELSSARAAVIVFESRLNSPRILSPETTPLGAESIEIPSAVRAARGLLNADQQRQAAVNRLIPGPFDFSRPSYTLSGLAMILGAISVGVVAGFDKILGRRQTPASQPATGIPQT